MKKEYDLSKYKSRMNPYAQVGKKLVHSLKVRQMCVFAQGRGLTHALGQHIIVIHDIGQGIIVIHNIGNASS